MKRRMMAAVCAAVFALGVFALVGCSSGSSSSGTTSQASDDISVYSREDGSGTRGAFVELLGIEQEDSSGEKVDMTTEDAAITNSTAVMLTSVAGDEAAIGYVSMGSLNDTVKAVKVDGVEPTVNNVKAGGYQVARPFNIVTKDGLSEAAQDFISYIMSAEGQDIIEEEGYIAIDYSAAAYEGADVSGKVVVAGSSSVTPVMEKLAEAYQAVNPNVTIEVQQSDSTTGVSMAIEGTCDIGMASRELKDSEVASGVSATVIAQDGIAVIVNEENEVDDLTVEQIMKIYTGEITSWNEVL